MKLVCKTIYWLAITFIAFIVLLWFAVKLVPLEFRESSYEEFFHLAGFFGIPVAIIVAIAKIGFIVADRERKRQIINNSILLAGILTIISLIYIACTAFDGMCGWSDGKVLFEKKNNNAVKLIERDFGCGAIDGTPPSVGTFVRTSVSPLFYYYKAIDTTKTDMSIWEKAQP